MEHRPNVTRPKDVTEFDPKDRALIELIDRTLHDHQLCLEGLALAAQTRWEEHDAAGYSDQIISE